jgi:hypothetical protein
VHFAKYNYVTLQKYVRSRLPARERLSFLCASKPGSTRTVAYCDGPDIHTCLWPAVRAGRCYVTDGPSLVFTVDDHVPGDTLQAAPGAPLDVHVDALAPDGWEPRVDIVRVNRDAQSDTQRCTRYHFS